MVFGRSFSYSPVPRFEVVGDLVWESQTSNKNLAGIQYRTTQLFPLRCCVSAPHIASRKAENVFFSLTRGELS